jgi:hypothetical protein
MLAVAENIGQSGDSIRLDRIIFFDKIFAFHAPTNTPAAATLTMQQVWIALPGANQLTDFGHSAPI